MSELKQEMRKKKEKEKDEVDEYSLFFSLSLSNEWTSEKKKKTHSDTDM